MRRCSPGPVTPAGEGLDQPDQPNHSEKCAGGETKPLLERHVTRISSIAGTNQRAGSATVGATVLLVCALTGPKRGEL